MKGHLLKEFLTFAPVLGHPDFDKEFHVSLDASYIGLGSLLYQLKGTQKIIIAYASRTLRPSEIDARSSTFLELAAIRWALTDLFHHFRGECHDRH